MTGTTSGVIVVARRWDGLGGRLHALLNAWSVARALGVELRFVWPRNAFTELREPRELFDGAFLDRFEIADSACGERVALPDPTASSLSEARARCRAAEPRSMIEIAECFEVAAFSGEPASAARARFRAGLGAIAWSGVVRGLVESAPFRLDARSYSAVHVRAGDIVDGDWRQFVPVEKYVPTAYVEAAIEALAGPEPGLVVVVSDNERYARDLKARFGFVRLPADVVDGYGSLSPAQRALADILVLSRARRIAGPRASAFSRLAAHLGDRDVLSVGDLMSEDAARGRLRDDIALAGRGVGGRWPTRSLQARDICWFLDVFAERLPFGEQIALAREAVRHEPDSCGALNRLAAALAFAGDGRGAARASSRALRAAALSDRHADPLVESLAVSVAARVVLALGGSPRGAHPPLLERRLERCESLTPFQTHHQDVLANLRFQIAAMTWLTTRNGGLGEVVRRGMRPAPDEPLPSPAWRPSGFRRLGASGSFPQTLRNVEVVSIRIAQAIGTALSSVSSRPLRTGNVDAMTTSPSGLRWVVGWARDTDAVGDDVAIGLPSSDGTASGGITFLARPDVAKALGDPRALHAGFAFPVPSGAPQDAGDVRARLRVFCRS